MQQDIFPVQGWMVLLTFKGKCNESALQNRLKSFWFQGNSFYSLGCCNTGVQLQLLLQPPTTRIITLMVMLPTKYKVDIDDRFQLKMFFPGLDAFPKRTLIIHTGIKYFYVIIFIDAWASPAPTLEWCFPCQDRLYFHTTLTTVINLESSRPRQIYPQFRPNFKILTKLGNPQTSGTPWDQISPPPSHFVSASRTLSPRQPSVQSTFHLWNQLQRRL